MKKYLPHLLFPVNFKSGQATLLAILIVSAIAIVTSVAVATRQNSSIRRTTYTSQTDQAFNCANSGVDAALLCIKKAEERGDIPTDNCGDVTDTLTVGESTDSQDICNYNYKVTSLNQGEYTITKLPRDSVQQFTTTNATGDVTINFKKFSPNSINVGLEVTTAFEDSSGSYGMNKKVWSCGVLDNASNVEGFTPLSQGSDDSCTGTVSILPSYAKSIIRIRPYFDNATVTVSNLDSNDNQGYLIRSEGRSGTVQRNIEVMRMNPQLPAIFDYVLYSEEGSITK